MELIAVIVGGILGWQHGTFGRREFKVMALIVAGWTAVTTAASVSYLTVERFLLSLAWHAVVVTVPYALGVLAQRIAGRNR